MEYFAPLFDFKTNCNCPINLEIAKILREEEIPNRIRNLIANNGNIQMNYWIKYELNTNKISEAFDYHFFVITLLKIWHENDMITSHILIDENCFHIEKPFHKVFYGPATKYDNFFLSKDEEIDIVKYMKRHKNLVQNEMGILFFLIGSADFHAYTINKLSNYIISLDGFLNIGNNSGEDSLNNQARRIAIFGAIIYCLEKEGSINGNDFNKWSSFIFDIIINFRHKLLHGDERADNFMVYAKESSEDKNRLLNKNHKMIREFTHIISRHFLKKYHTKRKLFSENSRFNYLMKVFKRVIKDKRNKLHRCGICKKKKYSIKCKYNHKFQCKSCKYQKGSKYCNLNNKNSFRCKKCNSIYFYY